jgi:hypothetical protein
MLLGQLGTHLDMGVTRHEDIYLLLGTVRHNGNEILQILFDRLRFIHLQTTEVKWVVYRLV